MPGSGPSPEDMKGGKGKPENKEKHLPQDNQAIRGGLCRWFLGHKGSPGSVDCELRVFADTNQPRHTESSFEKFSLGESLRELSEYKKNIY